MSDFMRLVYLSAKIITLLLGVCVAAYTRSLVFY